MLKAEMQHWQNWSGSVQAQPRQIAQPRDSAELIRLVKQASHDGQHIRVVGSGHSFTPLVQTDEILLSLDHLQGVESVDKEHGTATVLGGTKLRYLGAALLAQGVAQENLGDIDVQSIAGAISTGTHGTGVRFGNLSTQVEELTLLTASGELLTCSAEQHPDIFKAAQISLGMLGIIVSVKLRVVPAKRLQFNTRREQLSICLEKLDDYRQSYSHFEFYWMPYTEWVQAKFLHETEERPTSSNLWSTFNKIVLENGIFWLLSEISRIFPASAQTVSKITARGLSTASEVNYSHRLFATPRAVRFQEMEYNVPREHFPAVLHEIRACIEKHQFAVHFPIECRFVHADDIWLSPAYQRPSAYIAVHMYKGMAYQEYFQHIEEIFKRFEGRPHWGKMHTQNAESLAHLYPRWQDFQRVRASLDPSGLFLNDYVRTLFGIEAAGLIPLLEKHQPSNNPAQP